MFNNLYKKLSKEQRLKIVDIMKRGTMCRGDMLQVMEFYVYLNEYRPDIAKKLSYKTR